MCALIVHVKIFLLLVVAGCVVALVLWTVLGCPLPKRREIGIIVSIRPLPALISLTLTYNSIIQPFIYTRDSRNFKKFCGCVLCGTRHNRNAYPTYTTWSGEPCIHCTIRNRRMWRVQFRGSSLQSFVYSTHKSNIVLFIACFARKAWQRQIQT